MRPGGREELLTDMREDFGYLPVLSDHDRYVRRIVPWHWHQEVEMYYVVSGEVECSTPHCNAVLTPGSAGFVNANVLHSTQASDGMSGAKMYVHMFRPSFLAAPGTLLWDRYVEPLVKATSIELVPLFACDHDPAAAELCGLMQASFDTVVGEKPGWELQIRDQLSEIWLRILRRTEPMLAGGAAQLDTARSERLKAMLDYVGKNYPDRIEIADIAEAGCTSERECHRTFSKLLGTTPAAYLREYRLEQACRMLAHTTRPIGDVATMSGLGGASLFARLFREKLGCTPSEYRRKWQE